MILADKIINLRKKSGWSQEELAEKIGVSRQSISKWEGAQTIPDMNKILKLAEVFKVSTDYLLKDELEEQENSEHHVKTESDAEADVRSVSMEQANRYLEYKERSALPMAGGIFLCIISPIFIFILSALGAAGRIPVSEDKGGILGVIFLLLAVGIAVTIFVFVDHKGADLEFIEKEKIETVYGVSGMVAEKKKSYGNRHLLQMVIGIFLCIVSSVPLLTTVLFVREETEEIVMRYAVAVLLVIVGCGVALIVHTCGIWESYQALLEEGDYTRSVKFRNKRIGEIYWGSVLAVYLLISFLTGAWARTWIIWPVAGVAYGVIAEFYKLQSGNR